MSGNKIMTRTVVGIISLVVIFIACWLILCGKETKPTGEASIGPNTPKRITVVICKRAVPKGAIICDEDLEQSVLWQPKYPQDAISSPDEVVGKIAKYDIKAGVMVGYHDVGEGGHP